MRYKLGDEVMIRPDLKVGKKYYMNDHLSSIHATHGMVDRSGEIHTISDIRFGRYIIDDDKGYLWADEMFEEVFEPCEQEYENDLDDAGFMRILMKEKAK